MQWLTELLTGDTVAHAVLVIALVAAAGIGLGSIKVRGVGLGIAGVLFSGLVFGHFKITINHEVLEFCREFGLILFVYTVGLQVGPGFFASLRKQGLQLNGMAAFIVISGALIAVGLYHFGGIPLPAAVGLFSGATTNTPSLAAAQQALKDVPSLAGAEHAKLPGLAYAVSYPFGIMGIIITMGLVRYFFRISPAVEAEVFERASASLRPAMDRANYEVTNPNLNGLNLSQIPGINNLNLVVSRVLQSGSLFVPKPDTVLHTGDILHAVGLQNDLDKLRVIVGSPSAVDLKELPSALVTSRIVVTHKSVLGKSIPELDILPMRGVSITRVSRAEVEFSPTADIHLQYGDTVLAVGEKGDVEAVSAFFGNAPKQLHHPQLIPVFLGIVIGVIIGSWPIFLPGLPAPVKLGLAGGPLLVAILLSRLGNLGPLVWYMPMSANFMLREVGITLFLACVGLKAGDKFIHTLTQGDGLYWMACATLITLVPILVVGIYARLVKKLNYMTLCGLLAGSMTDPPALAFANSMASSDAPSVSYATVYPLVMILRILCAQLIVMIFGM